MAERQMIEVMVKADAAAQVNVTVWGGCDNYTEIAMPQFGRGVLQCIRAPIFGPIRASGL